MFTHYLLMLGCENPGYHGDLMCDDVNNNEACFFDGGDCCGSNVNTAACTECLCLELGGCYGTIYGSLTDIGYCIQGAFADGYCDSINNNQDCTFDGGDCCDHDICCKRPCVFCWNLFRNSIF